jgi:hypothetical protein
MAQAGVEAPIELRRIDSAPAAERERFLGSPTLRIDGEDVEPSARTRSDFGLECRLYATSDGHQRTLPDQLVLAALMAHRDEPRVGSPGRRTP